MKKLWITVFIMLLTFPLIGWDCAGGGGGGGSEVNVNVQPTTPTTTTTTAQ